MWPDDKIKSSQIIFYMKVVLFKIAQTIFKKICATFGLKFVTKKIKKSPNLVTLAANRTKRFMMKH